MNQISLEELVSGEGATAVARKLGVTPAAISKALTAQRVIMVTVHDEGTYEACELKPFPSPSHKSAA